MLLDSNIIIYSVMPENSKIREYLSINESGLYVSSVSKIEVLGYHKLTGEEKTLFENFFALIRLVPIDSAVIDQATSLRQRKRISLGDSIIAASALVYHQKLFTNNEEDFTGIESLEIISMKSVLN